MNNMSIMGTPGLVWLRKLMKTKKQGKDPVKAASQITLNWFNIWAVIKGPEWGSRGVSR